MKELFRKLLELQSITTDKNIESFIATNSKDEELMCTIGFIINKLDITNIDTKKWDKVNKINTIAFSSMLEPIKFIREKCTGKNSDVEYLKGMCSTLQESEQEIFKQIFTKTFKLGIGVKTFNPLVSDDYKLPQQVYNGCVPFNQKKIEKMFKENEYLIEDLKEDGLFLNANLNNGSVELTSRTLHYLKFEGYDFVSDLVTLSKGENVVLNGEIVIPSIPNRLVANGIVSRISSYCNESDEKKRSKTEKDFLADFGQDINSFKDKLVYSVWDVVPYKSYVRMEDDTPLHERRANLSYLFGINKFSNIRIVECKGVTSYEQLMRDFANVLSEGKEGLVVKAPNAKFVNKKNTEQVKMKLEFEVELEICGFEEGSGRLSGTLGNLIVKSSCGKLVNGTSGFSDSVRKEVWENKEQYLGKIVTCKCRGVSKNNQGGVGLLYNTFVKFRDDKNEANSWDEIVEIQNSILNLKESANVQ